MTTTPSARAETTASRQRTPSGGARQRNHGADHPGCGTLLPWDRGCQRWTSAELLRRAAAEVVHMRDADGEWMLCHMRRHRDMYRRRTDHRNTYIATVEGWRQQDFDSKVASAESFGRYLGWSEKEVSQEAALQWNLLRQQLALAVLFVYGAIGRSAAKSGVPL